MYYVRGNIGVVQESEEIGLAAKCIADGLVYASQVHQFYLRCSTLKVNLTNTARFCDYDNYRLFSQHQLCYSNCPFSESDKV
jgi:hypothetical protein